MPDHHHHGLRASKVRARGSWSAAAADSVLLDFEDRQRRHIHLAGIGGLQFVLDLQQALLLRGGDALELDDGRLVEVVAATENLVEVRAADALALTRLAWHLGGRHVPVEITKSALRIRADHAIETMLEGLGARLRKIETAFEPEGGAYASNGHEHGHHGHEHHDHAHHDHEHHDHDHHGHDHHHHK
ncbi:MAG: urease accessory protein UreE [Hyphomicrobiales bacterium]|nr:urease accessory protein UreE [Hyphomicrobiales bacterium]